jgi:hypothetical protein
MEISSSTLPAVAAERELFERKQLLWMMKSNGSASKTRAT